MWVVPSMVELRGARTCKPVIDRDGNGLVMTDHNESRSLPLSRVWSRTLLAFMVIVLCLGAVALGSTAYQRGAFNEIISGFEGEVDAAIGLNGSIRAADEPTSTDLVAQSLAEVRARVSEVDETQAMIPPIVLGILLLTMLLGAWSARDRSRRIVRPLLRVQEGAMRLRDGDTGSSIDVDGGVAELHALAQIMNDLAGSMDTSLELLHQQAATDALTGLPNRDVLTQLLRRRLEAGAGVALLFIDLDDFKVVNDSLGHQAGDELLQIIAGRLRSSAQQGASVARLGGDEFAVVLEARHDAMLVGAMAQRILEALCEPVMLEGVRWSTSCSIGIALAGSDATSVQDLIRNADIAMYTAKGRGKKRIELYAESMHSEMFSRMGLEADLARAVELDQLELHYQPVVDLSSRDILGWEALVRWRHPQRGLIGPGKFIALAEETGDILEIGRWVLDRACADLAVAFKAATPGCWMSVNVSPHQLAEVDFTCAVAETLSRYALEPRLLTMEITEGTLVADTARAAAVLAALRLHGVRIAVDDFGTGFSSLRYLQDLPVDLIKIDRSFISDTADGGNAEMLEAIVGLGQTLGLHMIAEGIERESDIARLEHHGRVAGQGYLIARPMPLSEAMDFAAARHRVVGSFAASGSARVS